MKYIFCVIIANRQEGARDERGEWERLAAGRGRCRGGRGRRGGRGGGGRGSGLTVEVFISEVNKSAQVDIGVCAHMRGWGSRGKEDRGTERFNRGGNFRGAEKAFRSPED